MTAPRHILLANVFFAPFTYGGATIVAEEVARALQRRGDYRITTVSLCTRAELMTYTVLKTEVYGITNYVINVPPGRGFVQMYDNPEVTEILGDLMDMLAPDLVHAHCLQDMGAGLLQAAKARDIPTILSVHDFWWLCERQFMIRPDRTYCGQNPVRVEACKGCVEDISATITRFNYLQEISALPDRVTYPSRFARDLSVASGFAPDRGTIWENGVRLPGPGFAAAQAARRAADPRPVFGFVGGPSQIKGWPVIRDAFRALGREDFRVIVVDGAATGGWWDNVNLGDLPGDWKIHPRFSQDTMDGFYTEIDVLLFMSQWKETFGLAIREALARGIGVIQTDSGGTVEHGAVPEQDLIPIGAPATVLRDQLRNVITSFPTERAPHPVAGYDDQAAAFDRLVTEVLAARGRS
ncbi:glycosyltransferase [Jannaschia pohangensis]|uniref:Glycosyltransferase involved in cell wall bisynthesis n=1 Tax=Jannaschia pohangensis TaxID=390807 RepID=A0A1I3TL23_9RHOB|nr:glycosyltransferase [Jannaschia pohangensis]SFJ71079.1 Glycosyltransferase involved in cell wall bisynthesis [Jannaschia pohangensis]